MFAGVGDLKRLRNDAFCVAGARFRALRCRCLKPPTQNPWKGCNFHVREVLLCSDHFAWQLQDFVASAQLFRGRRSTFEAST